MTMGGKRSLGAATCRRLAQRGLNKTVFAWAAMLTFCASSAMVTYGEDASAQQHKKKPKKPASTEIELDAGTHTLKLDYYAGLKSPTVSFDVGEHETARFVCRARPAATGIFWLVGSLLFQHDAWIVLEAA